MHADFMCSSYCRCNRRVVNGKRGTHSTYNTTQRLDTVATAPSLIPMGTNLYGPTHAAAHCRCRRRLPLPRQEAERAV